MAVDTHSEYVILLFHINSGYVNSLRYHVTHMKPLLLLPAIFTLYVVPGITTEASVRLG